MINIETKRLILRNFMINDFTDLKEIIMDKESSEYAIYDHEFLTSDDKIKSITERFTQKNNFFAVYEKKEEKVIGYVCLNGESKMEQDLGFLFHSKYKGKGYATEASIAVIHYAFETLKVEKLSSGTANKNYPACRLLDKLGFKKINESVLSFRTDADHNPIEFVGADYILDKGIWLKKRILLSQYLDFYV